MSTLKPVSSVFSTPGSQLERLLERTQYLQNLTRLLRKNIDSVLSEHIAVANLRGDTAILTADSPAWLSKIRYLAPVILQLLKQEPGLENLANIQFKVQPPDNATSQPHKSRPINLSASSSKLLESAASGVDDPELATALRRLSQKGNPQTD